MTPVRLSDLAPDARRRLLAQAGIHEPEPYEFKPLVQVSEAQYWQLMAIRSRLSRIAAGLTWAGVDGAIVALESELQALKALIYEK